MKYLYVVASIATLGSLGVFAQSAGSVASEVLGVERAEGDATVKRDRVALERLYADDYSCAHSNGVVNDKAREIAQAISSDTKWTAARLADAKVRVYGDAAIVTAAETLEGTAKGYTPGARRLTDVWVKRGGRWQEVACQGTLVVKDAPTAAPSAIKDLKPKTVETAGTDDRAILDADQAFARADLANDDVKAKALQTNDYSFVSRTGAVASPNDPPPTPLKSLIVAYDRVRAYGTLAVVQGSLLWTDVKGFSPGVLRFTRVWIKDGAAWRLAAEQRTPIAAIRPTS
jgi:ketosteroid isomerase-like protein